MIWQFSHIRQDEDPDTDQGTEKESENDEDGSEGEGTDVDLPSLAKIQTAYSKRGNRKKSVSTMVVKSQWVLRPLKYIVKKRLLMVISSVQQRT